jgi:hypothetical protein
MTKSCRNCFHSTHRHDELVCLNLGGEAHQEGELEKGVCSKVSNSLNDTLRWDRRCELFGSICAYWCEDFLKVGHE